jgi:hypothetical protein
LAHRVHTEEFHNGVEHVHPLAVGAVTAVEWAARPSPSGHNLDLAQTLDGTVVISLRRIDA